MTVYKDFTNEQYQKFFATQINENWGLSYDDARIVDQVLNSYAVSAYGLNRDDVLKVLKIVNDYNVSSILFAGIIIAEGGGAGGWINHYASDSGLGWEYDLRRDLEYMNSISYSKDYPPAMSAYEVLGGAPYVEDTPGSTTTILNSLNSGTIGRYYIPATMAGNSWVFATSWSEQNQGPVPGVYFGNPYDDIINRLIGWGIDVFNGEYSNAGTGTGSSSDNKNPPQKTKMIKPQIFLNSREGNHNILFGTKGAQLTYSRNILFLNYDEEDADESNNNQNVIDNKPSGAANEQIAKILDVVDNYDGQNWGYSNMRPAGDPVVTGGIDCSGWIGFVLSGLYPGIWNNGYLDTSTIYSRMQALEYIVFDGFWKDLNIADLEAGDIVGFSSYSNQGAGLESHIGIIDKNRKWNDSNASIGHGIFDLNYYYNLIGDTPIYSGWNNYAYVARIK